MMAVEILEFYDGGREEDRLTRALGRLEWIRTWEILDRHLPPAPARVLDVGGAHDGAALSSDGARRPDPRTLRGTTGGRSRWASRRRLTWGDLALCLKGRRGCASRCGARSQPMS